MAANKLCPKEVAERLGVSERTALRLMSTGEIESFRVGKLWRTESQHVAAYQSRQYERYRRTPNAA